MSIQIKSFFEEDTATFTHVISDPKTSSTAIIDSVLNYDQASGRTSTQSADEILAYLFDNNLKLDWILETHIHADHLTAAHYIREKVGGKIGISTKIKDVLTTFVPIFNTQHDTPMDASAFDVLFEDNQTFNLGNLTITVLHTPGHTPACACYLVEDAIFVGDTIFMPDVGTARTDFPGGGADQLYDSIQRILSLPDDTRIFVGHDYPTPGRTASPLSTVLEQKQSNILINSSISRNHFVDTRTKKDQGKPLPRLILPSLQVNLRAGTFGKAESNGKHYIKIPINVL